MSKKNQEQKKLQVALLKFYERPSSRVSIELFLSILLIISFSLFAIRPTLITIAELVTEIEVKEKLVQELQNKVAALATAQEIYQQQQPKITILDQAMPTQPQLITSLKIIEKTAGQENIIIESASLTEIPEEEVIENLNYDQVDQIDIYLSMRVLGAYPSIRDFISQLQNNRRTFIIEEIDFLIDEQITQKILKANLLIRIPYFGDKNV